ncbi:MAG: hypothetical protein ACKOYM_08805 [Actinomycetes bacterium]
MGVFVRHTFGFFGDLTRYTVRTGRWWFPLVLIVLTAGAVVAAAAKVAVPTVVYVLF